MAVNEVKGCSVSSAQALVTVMKSSSSLRLVVVRGRSALALVILGSPVAACRFYRHGCSRGKSCWFSHLLCHDKRSFEKEVERLGVKGNSLDCNPLLSLACTS